MSTIIEQSFGLNIKILTFFGLYPSGKHPIFQKIKCIFLYFFLLIMVTCSTIFKMIFTRNSDILRANLILMYLAQMVCFTFKFIPFIINSGGIKNCIDYFGKPFFEPKNQDEKKILNPCIQMCRYMSSTYFWLMVVALIYWISTPLVQHQLPVDAWLPYDLSGSLKFYSTFIFLSAACVYPGISGGIMDPLLGGLIYHIATQLKILKNNLKHLDQFQDADRDYQINFDKVQKKLNRCVIHHNLIFDYVSEYEKCFSWSIFCQTAGGIFVLCFCCIGFILSSSSVSVLESLTLASVAITEVFFYCYFGSILYEENNTFMTDIYMGQWYRYDVKIRKVLLLMMERSRQPMIIRTGKIINLTLETFVSLVKTSYSLVAVLNKY